MAPRISTCAVAVMAIAAFACSALGDAFGRLHEITWRSEDNDQRALRLLAEGRCEMASRADSQAAAAAPEKGRWELLLAQPTLVLLHGERNRVVRLYRHRNEQAWRYGPVAHRAKLEPRNARFRWLKLEGPIYVLLDRLAGYGHEASVAGIFSGHKATTETPPVGIPPDDLAQLKKRTPSGWSLTVIGNTALIARDKPVKVQNLINAPPDAGDQPKGFPWRYVLILRFADKWSVMRRQEAIAENRRTSAKIDQLRRRMRHITHKFDSYLPRTDDDRKLVAQLHALRRGLLPIPSHYSKRRRIHTSDSLGWLSVANDDEHRALGRVRKLVLAGFTPYDGQLGEEPTPDPG